MDEMGGISTGSIPEIGSNELQNPEFKLGKQEFRIRKLGAIKGYDVFQRHIRPCFASFKDVDITSPGVWLEAYGKMPYEHLSALTGIFYRHCVFL